MLNTVYLLPACRSTFSVCLLCYLMTYRCRVFAETAESHGGVTDTHDAVLTMPINFDDAQRKAVRYDTFVA